VREEYKRTFRDLFFETFGWKKRAIEGVRNAIAESRPRGQAKGDYALLRAVLLGLTRYPQVLRENLEIAASLEFQDLKLRRWFDILCQAVLDHPYVDEDMVEAILATSEIGPVEKRDICRDLGFSFFRRREPERARSELQEVIATLVAERQVERALAQADARLAQATEVYEWQEQQRLLAARKDIAAKLSLFAERAVESQAA
jgi:DNA primase